MKKLLTNVFIVIVVFFAIKSCLFDGSDSSLSPTSKNVETLTEEKELSVDEGLNEFKPINNINALNGWWTYGDDILKIDIENRIIKWNDGPDLRLGYLDTRNNDRYEVKGFFLLAYIGTGTNVLRAIVTINADENEIYLERMDGGISNRYKKLRGLSN